MDIEPIRYTFKLVISEELYNLFDEVRRVPGEFLLWLRLLLIRKLRPIQIGPAA